MRRFPIVARSLLLPCIFAFLILCTGMAMKAGAGGPLDGPTPPPDVKGIPTAGLDGSGIGYCVSVADTGVIVRVPFHVVNPSQRKARGLPPLDPEEFRASVRNAMILAGQLSRRQDIVTAAPGLSFPELGDAQTEDSTGTVHCATSTCYGKAPGSGCKPTGCGGACNDCAVIKKPSIQ